MGILQRRRVAKATKAFHRVYYDLGMNGGTWWTTRWFGADSQKCPLDMWVLQELIHDVRPDLIIEIGTYKGGSALYYAHLFDLLGGGEVVTVDITPQPDRPEHPRIAYVLGSSLDGDVLADLTARAKAASTVMVFLDGDHRADHVLAELRAYGPLVTPGSYMIAEDTNVNGRPVRRSHGPGPGEAVDAFLAETKDFVVDRDSEKFLLTFNPGGFLRRVRAS